MTARIIPAAELRPGPATIVVALPGRTIRSRVLIAAVEPHGVVKVAFASGDVLAFSPRSVVGCIDPAPRPRRPRRTSVA
ncbi:MAG TPA: hypothetical protein PKW35_11685 [Nannocystaceae bacterium]|nr:hypothetical protein [Nannocystaceae bacterium]